ncbi:MAG: hypothetical protein Q7R35_02955 [Elusimicrobiota bacterium]|nr:hypothetical protein [Elusimicrobiota bacterium]
MKKSKIAIAVATSIARAEGGTMGSLAETSGKISSIDMNKNFSEVGNVLGGFYSGSKTKGGAEPSVVYAEPENSQKAPALTEKEICNTEPSKITLAGKVPPLDSGSDGTSSEEKGFPIGADILVAGAVALAILGKNKSYSDDVDTILDANVDTVIDAVGHFLLDPFTSNTNPKPPPPNEDYDVHPSGGAPTCNGSNYCTRP